MAAPTGGWKTHTGPVAVASSKIGNGPFSDGTLTTTGWPSPRALVTSRKKHMTARRPSPCRR